MCGSLPQDGRLNVDARLTDRSGTPRLASENEPLAAAHRMPEDPTETLNTSVQICERESRDQPALPYPAEQVGQGPSLAQRR